MTPAQTKLEERIDQVVKEKFPLESIADFSRTIALQVACEMGMRTALELPEVKALKDELENCLNYIHWNADDLTGDDLLGDGQRTLSFNNRIMQIEKTLSTWREFVGKNGGEG